MEYSSLISYKQLSRKLQNKCSLVVKWESSLRTFYGRLLGLVTRNGISLLYMTMAISKLSLSKSGPSVLVHDLSQNMTLGFLTSVIRIPLVGQELNILPEYPSSSPISVVFLFCVVFCIPLFVFFSFSFWHCTVCPIYGFWFPMWYLQHFVMELMWISTTCTCTVVHLELY